MSFADAQSGAIITHGEAETRVTLAGSVKKGDSMGYSSGWQRALGATGGVIQMRCVAGEDGETGQVITVYFDTTHVRGSRFSGATVGGALYVAEGTAVGKYTQTAPSDTGDATTKVGYALSTSEVVLTPNHNTDSVA